MKHDVQRARRPAAGFTLIELMIVVAIVGVLAVLAIYGVRRYVASSKTAEARDALAQIGKDAAAMYERKPFVNSFVAKGASVAVLNSLCASASATVPSGPSFIKGRKYQSAPGDWRADHATNAGFACLKFTMDQPQYFMYGYAATGTSGAIGDTFTATANGDLNGDGTLSTFTLVGRIGNGNVLDIAPRIGESSPDE